MQHKSAAEVLGYPMLLRENWVEGTVELPNGHMYK